MSKSRRVKISFNSINSGKYTVISKGEISKTNTKIKDAMKDVVREFEKNESESQQKASELVLNA